MILTNIPEKIKHLPDLPRDIFLGAVLILSLVGAFMLGRISILEEKRKEEFRITTSTAQPLVAIKPHSIEQVASVVAAPSLTADSMEEKGSGAYVGSKTGKIYHLPWCSGAKRIKEENKVWFASKSEAELAGYVPAGNCKGI